VNRVLYPARQILGVIQYNKNQKKPQNKQTGPSLLKNIQNTLN